MFIGACFNEFPLSTSEEMTQTFNGDDFRYIIYINQSDIYETYINQSGVYEAYINQSGVYETRIKQSGVYEVFIEQSKDFTLER